VGRLKEQPSFPRNARCVISLLHCTRIIVGSYAFSSRFFAAERFCKVLSCLSCRSLFCLEFLNDLIIIVRYSGLFPTAVDVSLLLLSVQWQLQWQKHFLRSVELTSSTNTFLILHPRSHHAIIARRTMP
jgi:hypothetical protein